MKKQICLLILAALLLGTSLAAADMTPGTYSAEATTAPSPWRSRFQTARSSRLR